MLYWVSLEECALGMVGQFEPELYTIFAASHSCVVSEWPSLQRPAEWRTGGARVRRRRLRGRLAAAMCAQEGSQSPPKKIACGALKLE